MQTALANLPVSQTALDYTRQPPPAVSRVFGKLGTSPEGEAVIWCDRELRIVSRGHIVGVHLSRYEPERGIGSGEAVLVLRCRTGDAEREVPLLTRLGMGSLDGLAREVAAWLAVPLGCYSD